MNILIKTIGFILFLYNIINANSLNSGEQVFKAYCWGCHHQTSVAFGPSFQDIANKRSVGEIQGHIINPKSMYKQLGHKRSVMPAFGDTLSSQELQLITNFIISFKDKK
jgi:mono/diheme cytochrome c family protein